jgi:hypothetical protein
MWLILLSLLLSAIFPVKYDHERRASEFVITFFPFVYPSESNHCLLPPYLCPLSLIAYFVLSRPSRFFVWKDAKNIKKMQKDNVAWLTSCAQNAYDREEGVSI